MKKPKPPLVVDPRLLASPVRAEMIGVLQTEGPLAVRELAAHLSRPPDGLYHHVRLLLEAGLLREKARRVSGKREEIVYALVAPRAAAGGASKPENRAGLVAAAQTALRMAGREFAAAIEGCPPGERRARPRLSRQRVWLSDEGLEKVRQIIGRLEKRLAYENRRRRGTLHVVTTALVPLVRKQRT